MTIVAMARVFSKQGNCYVSCASDSEISTEKERFIGVINIDKLIKVKNAVIAIAGAGPMAEAIHDLATETRFLASLDFNKKEDVRTLGEQIFTYFKDLVERGIWDIKVEEVCSLLIATPQKLWVFYPDLALYEIEECFAVGAGSDVFLGAFDALIGEARVNGEINQEVLDKIMRRAVQITNNRVLHCGGETHIVHPEEPPKRVVKRKPAKKRR